MTVSKEVLTDGELLSPSVLVVDNAAIVAGFEVKNENDAPYSRQILLGQF